MGYAGRLLTPPIPAVTDASASETELHACLEKAAEAIRARDDFLAIAAHELRSPLNALALRIAALERMAERSGEATLLRELQRTRRTVDRYVRRAIVLLDLSRLHAGVLRPEPERVCVAEVVRNVLEDYHEEAQFHGASLHADVPPELAGVWDAHMIEQVVANLVGNAIKYGNGTPVLVHAQAYAGEHVCIEVSDQGPGIAPADRQRIFDKFERVVATPGDRAGYGLGLWIVGRMVAAHQGTIEVGSGAQGGALFRVLLPEQPRIAREENKEETPP
jgi:signal transduction histidine kinase